MFASLTLVALAANCMAVHSASDKNVTKRETDISDIFPDFKNTHKGNIGYLEGRRKRPVKRLALPTNFILSPVAENEGEDYYNQGGGESEDNYDNKDWSDVNRSPVDNGFTKINHTNLSDIEGIDDDGKQTQNKDNNQNHRSSSEILLLDNNEEKDDKKPENVKKVTSEPQKEDKKKTESREEEEDYTENSTEKPKTPAEEVEERRIAEENEKERAKAEAKKQKILSEVDDLKARHAKEQRAISEKLKEDEMYEEQRERDRLDSSEALDKYGHPASRVRPKVLEYEEYPEIDSSEDKYRLNPITKTVKTTTTRATTRATKPPTKHKHKEKLLEQSSGKLSVFKNPKIYMLYDDSIEQEESVEHTSTERVTTSQTTIGPRVKYSSKYLAQTTPSNLSTEDNERISLVPGDDKLKEGEPTLFFPKRRKNKRKKQVKLYTTEQDSMVAESNTEPAMEKNIAIVTASASVVPNEVTASDTSSISNRSRTVSAPTPSSTEPLTRDESSSSSEETYSTEETNSTTVGMSTSAETSNTTSAGSATPSTSTTAMSTGPSAAAMSSVTAPSGVMSASDLSPLRTAPTAADTEPAPSHTEEKKKPENYEHEHGGHKSHHAEHHSSHGDHGKKAYKGHHEDSKTAKGHHDKEAHSGEYQDLGGQDKHHHKEAAHFGTHHREEHGKKQAKYEESGKHSAGHSTKGSHDVHKKDEYEKKVEFFEEEGDEADEETHGGHHQEKKHASGGKFHKNNLDAGHHHHDKGDTGKVEKGGHSDVIKGHKSGGGHDSHGKQHAGHVHAHGKESGRKWVYHHGYPAKTAQLVLVDRRADQYTHGPQYFRQTY